MFAGIKKKWHDFLHNDELKHKIYMIVYDTDTKEGKSFDLVVISFIIASVLVVILESLSVFPPRFKSFLNILEWIFTVFFTVEYLLRLYCAPKPSEYAFSLFGMVDLMATLPTSWCTWIAHYSYLPFDSCFPNLQAFFLLERGRDVVKLVEGKFEKNHCVFRLCFAVGHLHRYDDVHGGGWH